MAISSMTCYQGSKIAYFLAGPVGPVVRISAIPTSHDAVPTKICQPPGFHKLRARNHLLWCTKNRARKYFVVCFSKLVLFTHSQNNIFL